MTTKRKLDRSSLSPQIIGWRERVALPTLGIDSINAKIDTGAATSALHVTGIVESLKEGEVWLDFSVHPTQRSHAGSFRTGAWKVGERSVRNTGGKSELRPVIKIPIKVGDRRFRTDITLTRRDLMGFRMLIGRRTLRRRFIVDTSKSWVTK